MEERISICTQHHHEEETPLISTMAFNGYELWCATCDAKYGMFGADRVRSTPKLRARLKELEDASADYRKAVSLRTAIKVKIDNEWVRPQDIDHATRDRLEAARQAYVFSDPVPSATV